MPVNWTYVCGLNTAGFEFSQTGSIKWIVYECAQYYCNLLQLSGLEFWHSLKAKRNSLCVFACLCMWCVYEIKQPLSTNKTLQQIQCCNCPGSAEIPVSWELTAGSEIKTWCWKRLKQLSRSICCHHHVVCISAPWTADQWLGRCHPSRTALSNFSLVKLLNRVAVAEFVKHWWDLNNALAVQHLIYAFSSLAHEDWRSLQYNNK